MKTCNMMVGSRKAVRCLMGFVTLFVGSGVARAVCYTSAPITVGGGTDNIWVRCTMNGEAAVSEDPGFSFGTTWHRCEARFDTASIACFAEAPTGVMGLKTGQPQQFTLHATVRDDCCGRRLAPFAMQFTQNTSIPDAASGSCPQ